ncbi:hypothetical protein V502_05149 [Pseudogymnoascus sp. VKM F-4520 (FW-2644)]|nr:hypothetical protein V502_05149 [Pseudogymnoascus sp. VKM F-4520 (FW-2644)]
MKVILTGATGFIGTEVLRQALLHPSITTLIVLSRRALSPPITHPKLQVIILADFAIYPPEVLTQLDGAEACIWTLGIKTSSVPDQRLVSLTYTRALATALTQLPTPPKQPIRFLFTGGALSIADPNSSALFLGPARKVKGEAETEILAFAARAENREKIEVVVTRPAMVHAPGSVVGLLMAGLPAALRGVGVRELAAVSLDVVLKGGDEGKVLENGELAARGGVLVKAGLGREK